MRITRLLLAAPVAVGLLTPALTFAQAAAPPVNNVFSVFREVVKVGKGAAHDAHETAWAKALAGAKGADRMIAMASLTGPNEMWYLVAYPTWADYEKSNDNGHNDPGLAAIDKQFRPGDAEFLSDSRGMTLRPRPELSFGGPADLPNMRFVSVTRISVRPGHTAEYEEGRKIVKAAHEKAGLTDKYAIYEVTAGAAAGTFYQFVARKTLAELDAGATTHGAAYTAALGGELGQAKLAALAASAVVSQETDHFEFTPSQSVPPDAWVTANPGFWKPKPAAPMDKKAPADKKKP
jgi:hypothetical protein